MFCISLSVEKHDRDVAEAMGTLEPPSSMMEGDFSSPERVPDNEVFEEANFEALEKVFSPDDDDDPFWDVEETANVEEEAAPMKVSWDPGEPTKQEWEEFRVDHVPYRSWCPYYTA